jgi:hypothetical protein
VIQWPLVVRALSAQVQPQVTSGAEQVVAFKTGAVNRLATSPHNRTGRLERIPGGMVPATPPLDLDHVLASPSEVEAQSDR